MSRGYVGFARYKQESNGFLIYEYSGENWNVPHDIGDHSLYDGLISIEKNLLGEDSWSGAIEEGRIKIIKECKNAFYLYNLKVDYLAIRIISKIFSEYKEKGEIPEKVAFFQ